jgi:hypothetical protein
MAGGPDQIGIFFNNFQSIKPANLTLCHYYEGAA